MNKDEEFKEFQSMYKITCRMNDLLWQCHDNDDFTLIDNIMRKCDTNKLSSGRIISLLTCCMWGQKRLPYYPDFFEKCRVTLMGREDWEDDLLLGLEPEV